MAVLGLICLISGVIMNVQVLRRSRAMDMEPNDIVRTTPWLVAAGLVAVGLLLLVLGAH